MGDINVEIKAFFWPKTPTLREIKLLVDEEVFYSKFMSKQEIGELAKQFRYVDSELMKIANKIEE